MARIKAANKNKGPNSPKKNQGRTTLRQHLKANNRQNKSVLGLTLRKAAVQNMVAEIRGLKSGQKLPVVTVVTDANGTSRKAVEMVDLSSKQKPSSSSKVTNVVEIHLTDSEDDSKSKPLTTNNKRKNLSRVKNNTRAKTPKISVITIDESGVNSPTCKAPDYISLLGAGKLSDTLITLDETGVVSTSATPVSSTTGKGGGSFHFDPLPESTSTPRNLFQVRKKGRASTAAFITKKKNQIFKNQRQKPNQKQKPNQRQKQNKNNNKGSAPARTKPQGQLNDPETDTECFWGPAVKKLPQDLRRENKNKPKAPTDLSGYHLREIIIDGQNVGRGHSLDGQFSMVGLQICVNHFRRMGHKVRVFLPNSFRGHREEHNRVLEQFRREGILATTPSRLVQGQRVEPYDDRFIITYAAAVDGVIVSNDQYRDLFEENSTFAKFIATRLLQYTFVGDIIMFPHDPLGRRGPMIDEFLRFPPGVTPRDVNAPLPGISPAIQSMVLPGDNMVPSGSGPPGPPTSTATSQLPPNSNATSQEPPNSVASSYDTPVTTVTPQASSQGTSASTEYYHGPPIFTASLQGPSTLAASDQETPTIAPVPSTSASAPQVAPFSKVSAPKRSKVAPSSKVNPPKRSKPAPGPSSQSTTSPASSGPPSSPSEIIISDSSIEPSKDQSCIEIVVE